VRRITTTLALALCLLGCTSKPTLLTFTGGICGWAGPGTWVAGPLVYDPDNGTSVTVERSGSGYGSGLPIGGTLPVAWPWGYNGHRQTGGEVEVRDGAGTVVATTGRRYSLELPVPLNDFAPRDGTWSACAARELTEMEVLALPTPPGPAFDLEAVKAKFRAECEAPSVLEDQTCDLIDFDGMRIGVDNLFVPMLVPEMTEERAEGICEQIAAAHEGVDGKPLGYEIVVLEGVDNNHLAVCNVHGVT
jgi:hypothetical protein